MLEGVLRAGEIDDVRDELTPHLQGRHFGCNDFEGRRSERVYALLAKAPSTGRLVEHPRVLALVESVLEPQYLLSAHLAINLHPGEKAQSWAPSCWLSGCTGVLKGSDTSLPRRSTGNGLSGRAAAALEAAIDSSR